MFACTVSRRGNRCAQVYTTDFEWARAFLMASRSEAHETSSLLFARDVSCQHVFAKYQGDVQDKIYQELKDAACHLNGAIYSLAKCCREIEEFKEGVGQK